MRRAQAEAKSTAERVRQDQLHAESERHKLQLSLDGARAALEAAKSAAAQQDARASDLAGKQLADAQARVAQREEELLALKTRHAQLEFAEKTEREKRHELEMRAAQREDAIAALQADVAQLRGAAQANQAQLEVPCFFLSFFFLFSLSAHTRTDALC